MSIDLKKQLIVKNQPGTLDANFDEMRAALSRELERYDIVVTVDTVGDAKKLCTELNQSIKHIATVRKEQASIASEPVREFEEKMKQFEFDVAERRAELMSQVKIFEAQKLELLKELLTQYRQKIWDELAVSDEFRKVSIDDLLKISYLTAKENLTSKAQGAVYERCKDNKIFQESISRRLLELENKCYRAGLEQPLERVHVEAFLFEADDVYEQRLTQLISAEIERSERAEKARQAKQKREQELAESEKQAVQQQTEDVFKQSQDAAQAEQVPPNGDSLDDMQYYESQPEQGMTQAQIVDAREQLKANEETAPVVAEGKARVKVICEFEIEVPQATSHDRIISAYKAKLEKAGFNSLSRVDVQNVG